ncbi:MAG: TonB-dependent receptor [Thermoanaerobaculia bacterium]|nr:TonB-dependent receptor [Thermoanaerobaculia bacterium]
MRRGVLFLSALLLLAGPAFAQTTGTTSGDIRGRVKDEGGLGLPGVIVTATNRETGLARSHTTDVEGEFTVPLLSPGVYTVSAELALFAPTRVENVRVNLGQATAITIVLKPAQAAEAAVTVTAEAALLDLTKTDLSLGINSQQIQSLPNVSRNFLSFSLTTPRVSEDRGPQSGAAASSGFSINGVSPRYNYLAVDGFDNNDQASGAVRAQFSQDAVQEYQVISNPYSAEYGRTAAGIINIVTKSGTNDFGGSLFYFYRSDSLSSEDPLTGEKVPLDDHRFGASVGGRLVKDRSFFFAAYERQSTDTANPVTILPDDITLLRSKGFEVENGNVPYILRSDALVAKIDHQFSPSHIFTLRGNWSKGKDENAQAWGGLVAKTAGGFRDSEDITGAASLTSVFGAHSFNEVRLLYSNGTLDLATLDPKRGVSITLPGVATAGTQRLLGQVRDGTLFQLFDAFSFQPGKENSPLKVKVGFDLTHYNLQGQLPLNFFGLYRFSALPASQAFPQGLTVRQAFAAGVPAVFAQGFGDPTGDETAYQLGGFLQADLDLSAKFILRLGARYDYENPIDPFPSDSTFSPRASFSYAPLENFRVKGGYGRFVGTVAVGPMFAVNIQNGVKVQTLVRTIQGGPSPLVPWNILPDRRFPDAASAGSSVVPPTILRPGEFSSAYTDQANLGFEVDFSRKLLTSVDFVWARGRDILTNRNINPITKPPTGRPNPAYSDIFLYESTGNSWYTGATVGLISRLGGLFEFTTFYTYADSEDDYIDWLTEFQPQDPLNPADERGPSIHAPKHKIVATGIFSNVGRGGNAFTRDWTIALILDWKKDLPYNILAGYDRNQNGDPLSDRPAGVGRNSGTLPDQFTLDLRISKMISFSEKAGIELVAVCTNITDHENVLSVQNVENQPNFGAPTLYGPGRIFQLGARFNF